MNVLKMKSATAAAVLAIAGSPALAANEVLLTEGFADLTSLFVPIASGGGGWSNFNFSDNPAGQGWFQGSTDQFEAHLGGAGSFLASGYFIQQTDANGDPLGGIADGLVLTRAVSLERPTQLSFWTRTVEASEYGDSLYVGYSIGGGIEYLPLEINPAAAAGAYPESWTQYSVNLGAQGAGVTGRFFFEYYIQDTAIAGNYIGLDSVTITAVPEPGTWLLMGLGAAALAGFARRRAA